MYTHVQYTYTYMYIYTCTCTLGFQEGHQSNHKDHTDQYPFSLPVN